MNIEQQLQNDISKALKTLFEEEGEVILQPTRKDFQGTYTFVVFPLVKKLRKKPVEIGEQLGNYLVEKSTIIAGFNVVQGFLNLVLAESIWSDLFNSQLADSGDFENKNASVLVEFSSPNTNKPLHLGHLRNNFLGASVSEILKTNGYDVSKVCLVNDRGIHICKSMIAYQLFGNGETPESAGIKGDHLAGKYYVAFDKAYKAETNKILEDINKNKLDLFNETESNEITVLKERIENAEIVIEKLGDKINITQAIDILEEKSDSVLNPLAFRLSIDWENSMDNGNWRRLLKTFDKAEFKDGNKKIINAAKRIINTEIENILFHEVELNKTKDELISIAQKKSGILNSAKKMLLKWEQGEPEIIELWKKMNTWVYDGFNATYKQIGVSFDKTYYESDTYVLGKDIVDEGLEKGVFFKKEDNSVWIDLTEEGMDEKLVLRGDGTSVYITQDLGTTELKFKDYGSEKAIWVVGNEQDYHFKVLFAILKKLGRKYADGCYHLSYGMVDLPTGKMKSREGTVVDADDLVAEMIATAKASTEEKGKVDSFTDSEKEELFEMLALGALKYFLLKVEPKKRMQFNPAESIDFQGNTGPFIQYTHARIKSILRKAASEGISTPAKIEAVEMASIETDLVYLLGEYKSSVDKAAADFTPSVVANYCYDLAKIFNSFYGELSVMNETDLAKRDFRLALIQQVAQTLKNGMKLLGIDVPERM